MAVLHDSMLKDNCLGKIDIELEHLLELQQSQPNEGKYHPAYAWIPMLIDN
jgi:hypothetical protein